jgi:hypothetical protein
MKTVQRPLYERSFNLLCPQNIEGGMLPEIK